ncbi:DUF6308 family protein [Streptomyces tibetensis]|uniref:DUF6308 family protein n=1 Tax=Streptomyces tibetensis TaxID=2382123 RepID=UPI0033D56CA8
MIGWTPKSAAICSSVTPGSRLRATRTTSSRNSFGYGLGTATSFQAASQQARSGVTYPCSSPDGSGPVVAGKLLARKRPHLIPIYDIRIKQLFERPKVDHSFWAALSAALRVNNGALHDQLIHLRGKAGIGEDIGVLRVFDVIAWMLEGRQGQVATS